MGIFGLISQKITSIVLSCILIIYTPVYFIIELIMLVHYNNMTSAFLILDNYKDAWKRIWDN